METVRDFIFLGSQIIADGDCSHEIKRRLLLGKKQTNNKQKNYDQCRHHIKNRDITLPTKVHIVKAMVFPVVIYECETGLQRRLRIEELMLFNCGVGEDT